MNIKVGVAFTLASNATEDTYIAVFLSLKHTHVGNLDSFKIHACDGQNVHITACVLTVGALWHKRILIPLAWQFIHFLSA